MISFVKRAFGHSNPTSQHRTQSPKNTAAIDLKKGQSFTERFRDVISDPLNILIERVAQAGHVNDKGQVSLMNGLIVPVSGENSYYGEFSDLLVINRGVHEPLEEYCFQEFLKIAPEKDCSVLELGSYWAHYSMWFLSEHPNAKCFLVEPESSNIAAGKNNFELNGFTGTFIQNFVSETEFTVDGFMKEYGVSKLHLLHSDIQGYELQMLEGGKDSFAAGSIEYVFLSTHSESLHGNCESFLRKMGYVVEVSSDHDLHSTSFDGFILARKKTAKPVFSTFDPLGRIEIANSSPAQILSYLTDVGNHPKPNS